MTDEPRDPLGTWDGYDPTAPSPVPPPSATPEPETWSHTGDGPGSTQPERPSTPPVSPPPVPVRPPAQDSPAAWPAQSTGVETTSDIPAARSPWERVRIPDAGQGGRSRTFPRLALLCSALLLFGGVGLGAGAVPDLVDAFRAPFDGSEIDGTAVLDLDGGREWTLWSTDDDVTCDVTGPAGSEIPVGVASISVELDGRSLEQVGHFTTESSGRHTVTCDGRAQIAEGGHDVAGGVVRVVVGSIGAVVGLVSGLTTLTWWTRRRR